MKTLTHGAFVLRRIGGRFDACRQFGQSVVRAVRRPSLLGVVGFFAAAIIPIIAICAALLFAITHHSAHAVPLALAAGSTLSSNDPTLLDLAKASDPDGKIADIVEILNAENPVLDDMVVIEGNLPTGHRTTIRTGLPAPTWRKLYGGVQPNKGTTVQVTDGCGMLEAYAEVDKALADLNNNAPAWRLSEDRAHIEGMSQSHASTLIYGDETVNPERFTGLTPRFNSLGAVNGENIINAGGVGNANASIWLVVWGKKTAHGIVPRGSKAGLQVEDKGQVTIENADGNGGRMEGYRTHYRWDTGLSVRDWRYIVRIGNIDVAALATYANCKPIINWMISATERIPNFGAGRPVFYMPRYIRESLRQGIVEKIANNLTWETVSGKRVMMFDEIPVKRTDAILLTEANVGA